jgi:multidrug transporter EmrE-like cation transporter
MILAGAIMNVSGMYLIKMKMNTLGAMDVSSLRQAAGYLVALARSPAAVVGVVLFTIAPLPSAVALSRMELSTAYPLAIAFGCLILVPLTALFFGESVSVNKIIAIIMIVMSLYFLYKS